MVEVDVSTLIAGQVVESDLIDASGELFLPRGHVIRAIDLTLNQARLEAGLFTTDAPAGDHTLTVSQLRVGESLKGDVIDAKGILLLAGGAIITETFIERLKARGIREVIERPKGHAPSAEPTPPKLVAHANMVDSRNSTTSSDAAEAQPTHQDMVGIKDRFVPLDTLEEYIRGGRHAFHSAVAEMKSIVQNIASGSACNGNEVKHVLASLISAVSADPNLAMLLIQYKNNSPDYLFQHCVSTAMVAMRVAAQMDHTQDDIMDVGLAAMLHDVGMLRIPDEVRFANRPLDENEKRLIEKHPDYSASMLENMTGLRPNVSTVVFQSHERMDGSGYPRRRSGMFIHPLARILGVVDTYIALTHDRPHRPARLPHQAIMHILGQAKLGRFDKAVIQGLLEAISLYPVGSYVQLSTEKTAKVLRSNQDHFAKPVVVVIQPDGSLANKELDLVKRPRTTIIDSAPAPEGRATAA